MLAWRMRVKSPRCRSTARCLSRAGLCHRLMGKLDLLDAESRSIGQPPSFCCAEGVLCESCHHYAHNRRSTFLTIASSSLKLLGRYGKLLTAIFRAELMDA